MKLVSRNANMMGWNVRCKSWRRERANMRRVHDHIERVQMLGPDPSSVEYITDVIRLALAPVFLLAAVAALLNVFSTRLGRVADRVDLLSADLQRGAADTEFLSAQLGFLRLRSFILDGAAVLATLGGAATCTAAFLLFLGSLRGAQFKVVLDFLGAAIGLTIIALLAFAAEMLLAGYGLRRIVVRQQKTADQSKSE